MALQSPITRTLPEKLRALIYQNVGQLLRFALVGVLNTGVDFGVFLFLNRIVMMHYAWCQICGYSAGVLNSFVWNKFWTFRQGQKHQNILAQFGKFLFINGLSLSLTLLGLATLIDIFCVPTIIAKIAVLIVGQSINFLGYKFLVFRCG